MTGRPPISERSARQLRSLLERRRRAKIEEAEALNALALATLRVHEEEDVSLMRIANALGVGKATVRDWVDHAKRLRGDT